jgi:hypothetical protein
VDLERIIAEAVAKAVAEATSGTAASEGTEVQESRNTCGAPTKLQPKAANGISVAHCLAHGGTLKPWERDKDGKPKSTVAFGGPGCTFVMSREAGPVKVTTVAKASNPQVKATAKAPKSATPEALRLYGQAIDAALDVPTTKRDKPHAVRVHRSTAIGRAMAEVSDDYVSDGLYLRQPFDSRKAADTFAEAIAETCNTAVMPL